MSTDYYNPTVRAAPNFNVQKDCEALNAAMKGIGTNEEAIVNILCKRSWQQRFEIEKTYKTLYKVDLEKEVDSETSGHFWHVLERLMKTPVELAAFELHEAIEGGGTDEECLVEVICTKSNDELRAIELKYKELYGRSLEVDVLGDTSGFFQKLLLSLLACKRPGNSIPDISAAQADAKTLNDAPTEANFVGILTSRSYTQLRVIFDVYKTDYKKDIVDMIKASFSGDMEFAFLTVVNAIRNPHAYFATRIYDAVAGAGTKDRRLLRIVVSRCDIDLGLIKNEFQRLYGKSLYSTVADETSGDYKLALLTLIGQ